MVGKYGYIYFVELLFCMMASHYMLGNPFFGEAVFLMLLSLTIYYQTGLYNVGTSGFARNLNRAIYSIVILAGIALMCLYPVFFKMPKANYVSFIALSFAAINVIVDMIFPKSFIRVVKPVRYDNMTGISSYEIFRNMSFYSKTAFYLGIFMYFCFITLLLPLFSYKVYIASFLWLSMVVATYFVSSKILGKKKFTIGLHLFFWGAALWVAGSIGVFLNGTSFRVVFWSLLLGFAIALISSSLTRFNEDFIKVAILEDREIGEEEMSIRNSLNSSVALVFSSLVTLVIMTVWTFVMPNVNNMEIPSIARKIMVQLPVLFMLISIYFALRQPLDRRNRQKLLNYINGDQKDYRISKNLNKLLIQKYRVRFGVKIIAFFIRPFLRLKVSGKEFVNEKYYPSVFVCNHGIIYGPVASVIYLPTYFRPWIDRKMLDRDLSSKEMYRRFMYRIPIFGEKTKMKMAYHLSRPVCWALNSFNPIPVERESLRDIMSTFSLTVKALEDGDNVLLFPEKPHKAVIDGKETVVHETDTVGDLFTGFANIGKIYYQSTGRAIRFYPVYSNKKNRTFRIGEPVTYNPEIPHKEEKERIAEILKNAMLELAHTSTKKRKRLKSDGE